MGASALESSKHTWNARPVIHNVQSPPGGNTDFGQLVETLLLVLVSVAPAGVPWFEKENSRLFSKQVCETF